MAGKTIPLRRARLARKAEPAKIASPAKPAKKAQLPPIKPPSIKAAAKGTVSWSTIEKLKAMAKAGRPARDFAGIDPFKPALPPPGVLPKAADGKDATIAMDDACSSSIGWAGSQFQAMEIGYWNEGLVFPGYAYLAAITQRTEYRRPAEIIATAMTRKWIRFQSSSNAVDGESKDDGKEQADRIAQITDEFDRLKVKDVFKKLAELDGWFGRAHLYLDFVDPIAERAELKIPVGNGRDTVSKTKVGKKKPLRSIKAIEPVWCYPTQYNSNNPLLPDWYNPTMWFCMAQEIHASRLICLVGREVPDMLKPAYSFGGISLSQLMKPYVENWLRTRQSVSDITHNFSQFVLASDLSTLMMGDELLKRFTIFNAMRDNQGAMLVDKNTEELTNVSAPLGSLDHLQAQAQEQMAAPSGIPLVVLFGITPTGLNATSEGEIRVFYDWIEAFQEHLFRGPLTRVLDFVQLSLFGEVDQDITFVFEPLWSLDAKTIADAQKVQADTDGVNIANGTISAEEARKRLVTDPDSPYVGLDPEEMPVIEEPDQDEDGEGDDDGPDDKAGATGGKGPGAASKF